MKLQGKRVLVTGAGGFIASHLAEGLVREGASVRAFTKYNSSGSRGWLDTSPLAADMEIIAGDVRDRDCVRAAMKGCEVVYHLAALVGIPFSYHAPQSYVDTNVTGTLNVLQAAREMGVERVVHTSTSEVYGTAQYHKIRECHPLEAQSIYAATKIAADKLAQSFHLAFGLPVVVVRPFNTFGERQSARAIIPTIISQCLAGQPVRLGNVHTSRDMNYVANTVDGFLLAGSVPEYPSNDMRRVVGGVFNLGSGREVWMSELAAMICNRTGRPFEIETDEQRVRPPGSEVERLLADSSWAKTVLGWEPRVSLEEGLERTIEWMRENRGRYRANEYAV